ncbi:unnamed protein product [Brachionus calyciflorus]|uniref:Reverse transcriptase domain-containing protein n=1 Tax=Brachionus calyciflorus TaxID=104777 RepID=A0A813XWC0_9BILA|nr:unnamed protein product [Brachionus calyciflorus]
MEFNTSVSFPIFYPDIDTLNNGPRWNSYLKRFQYFLVSKTKQKIEDIDEEIKTGIFLHHVGERVASIYENLSIDKDKYQDIVKKLTDYFEPQVNEPFERFNFSEAKQSYDESLDNYIARLRSLARNCNFTDIEKEIMNQVIRGCKSNELRRQGLRGMKPDEFLKLGRSIEIANSQAKNIEANTPRHDLISSLRKEDGQNLNRKLCKRCGYSHNINQCPAYNKVCAFCQGKNHFAKMCNKKNKDQLRPRFGKYNRDKINNIEEDIQFEVDYREKKQNIIDSLFTIDSSNELIIELPSMFIFKIQRSLCRSIQPFLKPRKSIAYAYQRKSPIQFVGEFETFIMHNGNKINDTVAVVKGSEKCLLGYFASKKLGIVNIINSLNQENTINQLSEKFPEAFRNEVGCLKNYEIKLDIDQSIKPTFQKHRRIPFSMRAKLKEIIDQNLKDDVLEVAKGPTSWVLATIPANKAIKRTQHVMPTIDDIINDVNLANESNEMVFSRIDLKDGFNQIKLAEDSSYIITFSTDEGIFR